MSSTLVDQLMTLGFTRYEAQAYLALLRGNPLTGYEVAKVSGVPRANVYEVLARLEERGAAMRVDEENATRFVPIASEELMGHLRRDFERVFGEAERNLQAIGQDVHWEPVMNSRGYASALSTAREIIASTEHDLLLAVWPKEAEALVAVVEEARVRNVKITTLCLAGCRQECGSCRGDVHRYRVAPNLRSRWLVLSSDTREILATDISNEETCSVRTRQRLLVELAGWYIRHTIAVAAIVRDLERHAANPLSPETEAILRSIGTGDLSRDWLAHLQTMIASSGASEWKSRNER